MDYSITNNNLLHMNKLYNKCDFFSKTHQYDTKIFSDYPPYNDLSGNIKTIYICNNNIYKFLSRTIHSIDCSFILVSGDSNLMFPNDQLTIEKLNKNENNNKIIHCFSQNILLQNEKFTLLPNGFYINNNVEYYEILLSAIKLNRNFWLKNKTPISFFNNNNNNNYILTIDKNNKKISNRLSYIKKYTFILCNESLDTINSNLLLETLLCKSIAIIKVNNNYESEIYKKLYSQLPVIIITDYNEICESFLYRYLSYYKKQYNSNELNYNKLNFNYWVDLINSYKI